MRLIVAWLGAALIGIVLHSQSEGRLFDEPYVYLFLAILMAIETRPGFLRRASAEGAAAGEALEPMVWAASPAEPAPVRAAPLATALADDAEA
jgi:hypothetical protein